MNDKLSLILKVLIASAAISIAIKSIGPMLVIPPTPAIALFAVLLPTVLVAIALSWRAYQYNLNHKAIANGESKKA